IFQRPATAPPQTPFTVWAFIGTNAVASGSTLAAHLRLTRRTPANPAPNTAASLPPTFNPLERRIAMITTAPFPGFESLVKPFKFAASPYEYKVTPLRECPTPESLQHCETPDKAADYWRMH